MSSLDPDIVAQLAEDLPPEAFAAVLETFAADTVRLIAALEAAHRADDSTAFARAAHTLAGAAGAVGARDLERLARRAMRDSDAADREEALPLAGMHARRAIAELRGMIRPGP
jgi:HPt (histidine-containing phosphotransfer) domain-containing protein